MAQIASTVVSAQANSIPRVQGNLLVQPMSFERKAQYFAGDTFDAGDLFRPAVPAGILMIHPPKLYPRAWRSGVAAFGRNYGDCLATEVAANSGKFLAGAMFREDPRYYPDQNKNVVHRVWHALAFTVVDRSETGKPILAFSNFAGSAAAGFVGRAYLPAGYNDLVHAGQRAGGTFGGYIATMSVGFATKNIFTEFTPEINRLGRKLHLPFVPKD